ncbi:MAG: hypothetical protein WBE38_02345 [Terracidiphilus sp.]
MPRSILAAGHAASPASAAEDYLAELAAICGAAWDADSLEPAIYPHFRLRMLAWSLSLSSVLWCSLIFAGRELWKVWR